MEKRKIDKVKRKKHRIPFESKNSRERNACPECDSINIAKRRSDHNYMCCRCGWTGGNPNKIIW